MSATESQARGELDLRPWAAAVDVGLVVGLLWPLSFQPEELEWVRDVLERATMAERRLPVLAAWARRWRVRESDGRGDLPLVHARWVHDVAPEGAGAGGGAGGTSTPPVAVGRRTTATTVSPPRELVHHASGERGPRADARGSATTATTAAAEARERTTENRQETTFISARSTIADDMVRPEQGDARATTEPRIIDRPPVMSDAEAPRPVAQATTSASGSTASTTVIEHVVTRGEVVARSGDPVTRGGTGGDRRLEMPSSRSVERPRVETEAASAGVGTRTSSVGDAVATVDVPVNSARVRVSGVAGGRDEEAPSLVHAAKAPVSPASADPRSPGASTSTRTTAIPTAIAGAREGTSPRPRVTAQAHREAGAAEMTRLDTVEVSRVEAIDRTRIRSTRGRRIVGDAIDPGAPGAAPTRPRVQAARIDDDPRTRGPRVHLRGSAATIEAAPVTAATGAFDSASTSASSSAAPRPRPRVRGEAGEVPSIGATELPHVAAPPSPQRSTTAAAAPATGAAEVDAPAVSRSAPAPTEIAAPELDVDTLVKAVKRRLAREIRWERELRRAMG